MIGRLRIRGLGVISAADLDIAGGMVAFTGETGAGKTMVVSALGLVLGDRFDSSLAGAEGTQIDATVVVPEDGPVARRVRDAGGRLDPVPGGGAELLVNRSVSASGRGRAFAGGAPVPVALLAEIGATLAQRHSQSDQIALRSPRRQREALDTFGGATLATARAEYRAAYDRFLALSQELETATRADHDRAARVTRLRGELSEISDVAPQPGEDVVLAETIGRLSNAEALRTSLQAAFERLHSEEGTDAGSGIGEAMDLLGQAAGHDPGVGPARARLAEAQTLVVDVAAELRDRLADLTFDPAVLADLQLRRARLAAVVRKYGGTPDTALAHAAAAAAELAAIDLGAEDVDRLRRDVAAAVTDLVGRGEALSTLRQQAAQRLATAVSDELAGLAMPQARFRVLVSRRADPGGLALSDGSTCAFGPHGVDVVAFLLAPHAGAAEVPLGDGASGGELSRIMLALEVVLAASAPPGIYVFDEVDAGIGGRTAVEVGRRLAQLARQSQVFVVTHLAQVASFADQHIVVRKDSDGVVTQATVTAVTGGHRTEELSRMLSGQQESAAARTHAEELLDLAALETGRREEQGASR